VKRLAQREELDETIPAIDGLESDEFLKLEARSATISKKMKPIFTSTDLDGTGKSKIETGIAFF
jgi:imidazoleglycerol-phosphate dehydratase/histidinol-phosphatase